MALRPPAPRIFKTLYAVGFGPLVGRFVLLLTTNGRKTGLPRVTPLQYEELEGAFLVGSSRGTRADWFRNILADPHVSITVGSRRFRGMAEPVTDPNRIADFLQLRLSRHPAMIGAILKSEGLQLPARREDLERYAARLAMVVIKPEQGPPSSNSGPGNAA